MDVKQNLRQILQQKIIIEHIMDQNEFARALGESPQNANKWFNPNTPNAVPNVNHYVKITELLGVTIYDIFGINNPSFISPRIRKIIDSLNENPESIEYVERLLGISN